MTPLAMTAADNPSSEPSLERFFDPRALETDAVRGVMTDAFGRRALHATQEFTKAIHYVAHRESSGVWREAMIRTGRTCGKEIATRLDEESARLDQPALGALPLETCLVYLERTFAAQGWGLLKLDLSLAGDHGIVMAHLDHSYFAEALGDTADFADPFPAGLLQGFFEHISGEQLGCLELACVRRGAPRCTFAITASERLDAIAPFIGRESVDAILTRLKS